MVNLDQTLMIFVCNSCGPILGFSWQRVYLAFWLLSFSITDLQIALVVLLFLGMFSILFFPCLITHLRWLVRVLETIVFLPFMAMRRRRKTLILIGVFSSLHC